MSKKSIWDFGVAVRSIALTSAFIALMRLSLSHIRNSTIAVRGSDDHIIRGLTINDICKPIWLQYCFDAILYPQINELEEHPIDPDSIIDSISKRTKSIENTEKRKAQKGRSSAVGGCLEVIINLLDPHGQEEVNRWKQIEANPRRAMPKPFGTRAREVAAAKATAAAVAKAAEEDFWAELGGSTPKVPSKKERKAQERAQQAARKMEEASKQSTCSMVAVGAPNPRAAPAEIRDITLRLADRMRDDARSVSVRERVAFTAINWVKHPTDERYLPTVAETGDSGRFTLTASQQETFNAIRTKIPFSFNMEAFLNLMGALGIRCSGQKGSHLHIATPGRLPKIFVDPHGWTDKFGPGAIEAMHNLLNSLSLGEGSPYLELEP